MENNVVRPIDRLRAYVTFCGNYRVSAGAWPWHFIAFLCFQIVFGGIVASALLLFVPHRPEGFPFLRWLVTAAAVVAVLGVTAEVLHFFPNTSRPGESSVRGTLTIVEVLAILGVVLILSLRFVSLPFLVLAVVARLRKQSKLVRVCWVLFVTASVSPIDLALPGAQVYPRGQVQSGVRLVRIVRPMHSHALRMADNGDYIVYHVPTLNLPVSAIVWP